MKKSKTMISSKDLADRWDCAIGTLANWRCKKFGPKFFKLGKKVSYKISDIEAYEKKHTQCK